MAIDNLLYLNGLDFACETLAVGSSLCIRDSCKLYKVSRILEAALISLNSLLI